VVLLLVGLLFKVGAVPFHSWTPDAYQGAPTPVTGFMAACTKLAAFGVILRVAFVGIGADRWDWQEGVYVIAVLTMVVGAVLSVTQTDVKRLLAYSSVAHAGFILAGVIATNRDGVSSVLFYLAAYSFVTLGAFAVVTLVRDAGGEATHLSRWAGLGKEAPIVAGVFAFFLLSMAGIPLTAGFAGKWAVFTSAVSGGAWPLVVVAVVLSAVAAFFYARVIVVMFFSEPVGEGPVVMSPGIMTTIVIAVGFAVTVILGIFPGPVLDLAATAGQFIR
jgi:NADH-quinone oxidoreductase subunit N